jgi:hypothetical protein
MHCILLSDGLSALEYSDTGKRIVNRARNYLITEEDKDNDTERIHTSTRLYMDIRDIIPNSISINTFSDMTVSMKINRLPKLKAAFNKMKDWVCKRHDIKTYAASENINKNSFPGVVTASASNYEQLIQCLCALGIKAEEIALFYITNACTLQSYCSSVMTHHLRNKPKILIFTKITGDPTLDMINTEIKGYKLDCTLLMNEALLMNEEGLLQEGGHVIAGITYNTQPFILNNDQTGSGNEQIHQHPWNDMNTFEKTFNGYDYLFPRKYDVLIYVQEEGIPGKTGGSKSRNAKKHSVSKSYVKVPNKKYKKKAVYKYKESFYIKCFEASKNKYVYKKISPNNL